MVLKEADFVLKKGLIQLPVAARETPVFIELFIEIFIPTMLLYLVEKIFILKEVEVKI